MSHSRVRVIICIENLNDTKINNEIMKWIRHALERILEHSGYLQLVFTVFGALSLSSKILPSSMHYSRALTLFRLVWGHICPPLMFSLRCSKIVCSTPQKLKLIELTHWEKVFCRFCNKIWLELRTYLKTRLIFFILGKFFSARKYFLCQENCFLFWNHFLNLHKFSYGGTKKF